MDRNRDDEGLLDELRSALATADPVPETVVSAAKASFSWMSVDDELAELVSDSATQSLASIRSEGDSEGPRLLTFEGAGLTVEVEVTPQSERRRLVGQLIPPRSAEVEVCWLDGSTASEADDVGLFSVESVPAGPVSIACSSPEANSRVVTGWVTI